MARQKQEQGSSQSQPVLAPKSAIGEADAMLDRVAQAILARVAGESARLEWSALSEIQKNLWRGMASAALETILEEIEASRGGWK